MSGSRLERTRYLQSSADDAQVVFMNDMDVKPRPSLSPGTLVEKSDLLL